MVDSGAAQPARLSPRERLLAAADELFYADGVHVVGVDRVLARAEVAKASMYHHFASKEALVAAYLDSRSTRIQTRIHEAVGRQTDPRLRLLAVFETQARWLTNPGYRGCAFTKASAEAPAGGLVQQAVDSYRKSIQDLLTRLAAEAGAADPVALGLQLQLLYHGAAVLVGPEQRTEVAAAIRSAAATLLEVSAT